MKPPKIYSILPKLLHNTSIPKHSTVLHTETKSEQPYFLDTRMDFYFRKVLKANSIGYVWHKKERRLVVNSTRSPFHFFLVFEPYSNYITVRKIPWDDFEYNINAIHLDELFKKMNRFRILTDRHLHILNVPIALKAQQLKLIYG